MWFSLLLGPLLIIFTLDSGAWLKQWWLVARNNRFRGFCYADSKEQWNKCSAMNGHLKEACWIPAEALSYRDTSCRFLLGYYLFKFESWTFRHSVLSCCILGTVPFTYILGFTWQTKVPITFSARMTLSYLPFFKLNGLFRHRPKSIFSRNKV